MSEIGRPVETDKDVITTLEAFGGGDCIEVGSIIMSNPCNLVVAAFVRAQKNMPITLERDKTATVKMKGDKGIYTYDYTSFDLMLKETRPHLNAEDLVLIQMPKVSGASAEVTTMVLHTSGQYIAGINTLHGKSNAIHDVGSAISYNKRYTYGPFMGVTSQDDDDGKLAQYGTAGGDNGKTHEREARTHRETDRTAVMKRFYAKWDPVMKAAVAAGISVPEGIEAETPEVERAMKAALFSFALKCPISSLTQVGDEQLAKMAQILDAKHDESAAWYGTDAWHEFIPETMLKTAPKTITVIDSVDDLRDKYDHTPPGIIEGPADDTVGGPDEETLPDETPDSPEPDDLLGGKPNQQFVESPTEPGKVERACVDCGLVLTEKDVARIEAMGLKRDLCVTCTTAATLKRGNH